ncbi:MAG: OB-fold domain-containing protein [Caulobacteraceae bacterium]|nr:OB-fold domain-containing protein [Caulobacteraceae bacterium]
MIEERPLPTTDEPVDAAFWRANLEGRLLVQTCAACGLARHPPRAMCPDCQSMAVEWRAASGRGRLWSWAVPAPPLLPAFAALTPYVTAVVELDDYPGLRLVGPMLVGKAGDMAGFDASALRIGQAVQVGFSRIAEDVALPGWRLADPQ